MYHNADQKSLDTAAKTIVIWVLFCFQHLYSIQIIWNNSYKFYLS